MVDARLADGSRVNVVIPPLSIDGPVVSIRRFGARRPGPEGAGRARDARPASSASLLEEAVAGRRSILISGGTGSGKTTLLNALSSFIAAGERVVTIEDAAELRLQQPHVVRLESRPASVEGRGEVTIRDLLRNALRMRPDRIVIGEVRGAEALDLLTALNTGHDGALSTVHANSPADAIARIETLALMAGVGLPHEAIAEQARRGIDLVVQIERRSRRRSPGDRDRRGRLIGSAPGLVPLLLGAGAGGLLALGAREALLASPAAVEWVRLALEPLLRAGREGYSPSTPERRRLAAARRRADDRLRLVRRRRGGGPAARGGRPRPRRLGGLEPPRPLPLGRRARAAGRRRRRSPTR